MIEQGEKHYEKVDYLYHNGSHDGCHDFMGTGNNVFADDEVTYDSNMQTKKFDVNVKVGKDGSYTVTENIKVKFVNPRHGIYRYIPYKGNVVTIDKNGGQKNYFIMQILIC